MPRRYTKKVLVYANKVLVCQEGTSMPRRYTTKVLVYANKVLVCQEGSLVCQEGIPRRY